jgi:hypothetical protein
MTGQFSFLALIGLTLLAGCGSSQEPAAGPSAPASTEQAAHDPHDVPLTDEQKDTLRQQLASYPDAVAKIKSYRDTIRDAIAAGQPAKAHRPLDELDVVLEHLTTVARDSNVARTNWESAGRSVTAIQNGKLNEPI